MARKNANGLELSFKPLGGGQKRGHWGKIEQHWVEKSPGDSAFSMPKRGHGSKMVQQDLHAARTQWIGEAANPDERKERKASNFLRY